MEVEIYTREEYLAVDTPLKQYLLYAQKQLGEYDCEYAKSYHIVGFKENSNYVAVGLGCLYPDDSPIRNTQWNFHENCNRELWVDTLWSEKKGYGIRIMKELESILGCYSTMVIRPNIYVRAKTDKGGYYTKLGYQEIWTKDHPDDNVDGDTMVFQGEYGKWYAKGCEGPVVDEEIMVYDTVSSLGWLAEQCRFDCIRERITIPPEIPDTEVWDFLGKQDKNYFLTNFFKPTTDKDVDDLMMCFD